MTGKTISLQFDGYYLEEHNSLVTENSGIYCVYRAIHKKSENEVTLNELLYIGESGNVRTRLANHEKLPVWMRHLKSGEILCYSVAKVPPLDRIRVESALICEVKPRINSEYTGTFKGSETTVTTSGCNKYLPSSFTTKVE